MRGPLSWNRWPRVDHRALITLQHRHDPLPKISGFMLAHGAGRSYGDVCLNAQGTLLLTRRLDRFIEFDRYAGRLRCESGVLLHEALQLIVPQGWFLPVTPGTSYVTIGGAIANDVHGKNHHWAGSFGHHVRRLGLLRSDGSEIICSPTEHSAWFAATVGGLGLTGLILWAELDLLPISNPFMLMHSQRMRSLDAFWDISAQMSEIWPYTVAWVDCLATGSRRGRGVFFAARHAPAQDRLPRHRERTISFPIDPPFSLVGTLSLRAFNELYYRRSRPASVTLQHYSSYFYPLDRIRNWNRMYGRNGFLQYQCVLPLDASREAVAALLTATAKRGQGSFLAVLKTFGDMPAAGMLSFTRPGVTLALDCAIRGASTFALFQELDAIVSAAGGAVYPAKDARMAPRLFRSGYPRIDEFLEYMDPQFSSSFWRRVTA
jgi:FAD/FMN-containing dehydrogenase